MTKGSSRKFRYNLENINLEDNPDFEDKIEKHAERQKVKADNLEAHKNLAFANQENEDFEDSGSENDEILESISFLSNLSESEILNLTLNQLVRDGRSQEITELLNNKKYTSFRQQLLKCDDNGLAPIHYAAKYNQVECADVILNFANSRKDQDLQKIYKLPAEKDRLLPIHLAARYSGPENTRKIEDLDDPSTFRTVLDLLLFYASPNLPPDFDMKRWSFECEEEGEFTNILAVSDEYGMCAMHHAVQRGCPERVQRLVNFVTDNGDSGRRVSNGSEFITKTSFNNVINPEQPRSSQKPSLGQKSFLDSIVNNPDKSNRTRGVIHCLPCLPCLPRKSKNKGKSLKF